MKKNLPLFLLLLSTAPLLAADPAYSARDAVYYHLAESLYRSATESTPEKKAEALPYFERLVKEFEKSEYLELAQKRVAELKTQ